MMHLGNWQQAIRLKEFQVPMWVKGENGKICRVQYGKCGFFDEMVRIKQKTGASHVTHLQFYVSNGLGRYLKLQGQKITFLPVKACHMCGKKFRPDNAESYVCPHCGARYRKVDGVPEWNDMEESHEGESHTAQDCQ